jgi:hypothetical protein
MVRTILPDIEAVQSYSDSRHRRLDRTLVHLAEQLYRREHGDGPRSLGDLIGPYLDRLPDGYAPDDPAISAPARPGP